MNSEFSDSMDPSLLQLERELQSLTPVAPGRDLLRSLQSRMEPALPAHQTNKVTSFPWRRMVAPAAAAAAAVAVLNLESDRRAGTSRGKSVTDIPDEGVPVIKWEPMPMRREYRQLLDAGYVLNENLQPMRHYVLDGMDQHEWRNGENASVRLLIPRQQRFLMPVQPEYEQREGLQQVRFY